MKKWPDFPNSKWNSRMISLAVASAKPQKVTISVYFVSNLPEVIFGRLERRLLEEL